MLIVLCDICGTFSNYKIDISDKENAGIRVHMCSDCCKRLRIAFINEFQQQIQQGWEVNGVKRSIKDECDEWIRTTNK